MPAIPMSATQIADDLSARITAGDYGPPGTQLPTYGQLAKLYSVGMTAIAKVILLLKERGVVATVQGRGTFVADQGKK